MQALREMKTVESGKISVDIPFSDIKTKSEEISFSALSENKFNEIWNNEEDSVYDKFLQ